MLSNSGYNQYISNSINTATPEELTLMLYNGLVKFIMQAQSAAIVRDIEKANEAIKRAQAILVEFRSTLNMNYEVSKHLESIYEYMHRQLLQANIKKDKDILEEVLGYAKDLRDTWTKAMKLAKQQHNIRPSEVIAK